MNHQLQRHYVGVFTTETFAYYLHCRLLSVTQCRQVTQMSLHDISQQFAQCISEIHQLFIGDVLVFKSLNHALKDKVRVKSEWGKCGRSAVTETALNITELVELLQRSAVDHLTTYRQLEALLLYSRLSQQTLRRCTRINMATISGVYSCLHRTYARCCMLFSCPEFPHFRSCLLYTSPSPRD